MVRTPSTCGIIKRGIHLERSVLHTLRQLDAAFIATVGAGDPSIANAVHNLNAVTRDFYETFAMTAAEVPAWSGLHKSGATHRDHFLLDLASAHQLIGRRIAELLWDLIDSLERRRLLVSTLTARALIESAALAAYCEEHVAKALSNDGAPDLEALVQFLHRIIGGGRFDWERAQGPEEDQKTMLQRFATATSAKDTPEPPEERKAFNVLTMLGRLDRRAAEDAQQRGLEGGEGVVRAIYAILSDFCHPAVGSAILHVRPARKEATLEIHSSAGDLEVRYLFTSALMLVAPVMNIARGALNDLVVHASALEGHR